MSFKLLKKLVSVLTIATFLATNVVYAAPNSKSLFKNKKVDYNKLSNERQDSLEKKQSVIKGEDAKEIQSQQKEAKKILSSHLEDISQIHIPQELGRITEVYNNASSADKKPNLIVHIQDLHTNPEAELNLAKILELLLKDYNMGLVCSEGADGKVDTSSISSFPDSQAKERVSRIFIDSGELTGEEYLSITKYPELPIWGIEDRDIYFKNIIGFNNIMKFSPDSQVFISQVKKAITELKPKVYSKDLLDLDQKESEFSSQKLDTAKYIQYLASFTKKLSISMSNYKNISLLTETMEIEKTIDQLKIMNQSQNLLLNLQSILQSKSLNNDLDGLIARSNLFKDQKISPFSFYSYLKDLANRHLKEEFSVKYPEFNSFIDYLTKVNLLDSAKLFTELEDLNYEIKEALSKTDEQKTLVKADHNINFLESFFNLKVSNEDLDYYLNNKDSHKVVFFKTLLPKTLKKYNINAFIDYNPALIDNHLQELEDFYEVVKDRDIAMVTNSLSEIEKRNSKVSSLIAGGFHTKGITKLLREKGYSYIVVSPYSKTDIDEENYHFLLSGKRKPIADLIKKYLNLPEIVNRLAPSTLRVPLAYSETAKAFAEQIAGAIGEERTAVDLAGNMASLLGVDNDAALWAGFGDKGIIGLSFEPGVVVVPWGSKYLEITASGVTVVSAERYTGDPVVNIPPARAKVAGVGNVSTSTYSFLNNCLQGMGISVDQNGQLTYSDNAISRGLDRDYEQAGVRTVGDLLKKGVIGKLAQMSAEFLAIQETVLYNMIHRLVPTPRQKLGKTLDGSLQGWSTLNFTSFSPDLTEFPDGEIVKTTGHFNPQLDIQQVGQGEFISLQIKYDEVGNPIENRAQYLKPGDIFYALPGYFHVTIPVGEGPHSFFDIGYADGTYNEASYDWPNNTPAPYLFVNRGGKITVVLNPDYKGKDVPLIKWYNADKLPEAEGSVSLIDLYAKADESGMARILNAIEVGNIEAGTQVASPSQVEMTFSEEKTFGLEYIAMVPAVQGGMNGATIEDSEKRLPDSKLPVMPAEQFNFVPAGYDTAAEALNAVKAVVTKFQEITAKVDWSTVNSPVQVLKWMTQAINETPEGVGVFISIDMNADELRANDDSYYLGADAKQFGTQQKDGFIRYQLLAEYYQLLATDFSRLIGIERAFAKSHEDAWKGARSMASLEEIGLDRDRRFASLSMSDLSGLTIEKMTSQGQLHFYGSDFMSNYKTGVETRVVRNTIAKLIKDKSLATKGKAQAQEYAPDSWRASLKYEPKHTGMGTSGFRGTVDNMRDAEPYAIASGFVKWLIKRGQLKGKLNEKSELIEITPGQKIVLTGDFRDSSPDFMSAVLKVYEDLGVEAIFLGNMATPNMAYYCQVNKVAGIMITGSHTEGLYNGLKLYDTDGEVLNEADPQDGDVESDRKEIMDQVDIERQLLYNQLASTSIFDENGYFKKDRDVPDARNLMKTNAIATPNKEARSNYVDRFLSTMFKGHKPFEGHAIIYWEQSTVVRSEHVAVFEGAGAEVIRVGRRDDAFIALDTENMTPDHLAYLKEQVDLVKTMCNAKTLPDGRVEIKVDREAYDKLKAAGFDVRENIIGKTLILLGEGSSDGDGDRPVTVDEKGIFRRGDVTGAIAGETLGAEYFVQSLTGNQNVIDYLQKLGVNFVTSSVGSPYHVKLIRDLLRLYPNAKIIGAEVNGGIFIGSRIVIPIILPSGETFEMEIDPLNTRDATTVMLLVFLRSIVDKVPVSALFEGKLDHYADNAGLIHEMPVIPGAKRTGVLMHEKYTPEGRYGLNIKQVAFDDNANTMVVTYRGAGAKPETMGYDSDIGGKLLTLRNELQGFFTPERGFGTITQMAYGNLIDDGFVMWDSNGDRFHVRRSGNAPETRLYVYASTKNRTLDEARVRAREIVKMATEPGGILREIEASVWNVEDVMSWLNNTKAPDQGDNVKQAVMVMNSKAMGNVAASDRESSTRLVFEGLKKAVQNVYGESGLSNTDLRRTYMRTFYYWETSCYLNRDKDPVLMASNISDWLKDEVMVEDIFSQPVGSLANYAIVRDLSQGHRIREILDYISQREQRDITREGFLQQFGPLTNETELLLIRMAQLEEKLGTEKRAVLLCNRELRDSIERYCAEPYKLTTDDVGRKYVRTGKLWAGTNGPYGALQYLDISEEQARQMSIGEPETISGRESEVFTGEMLMLFANEQMPTLEPLAGAVEPVSDYQINLLFGRDIMGTWAYERFDGYQPYTIKYLFAGPGISNQIHLSKGLHGKPETFIMLAVHPELGEAVFGFKEGVTSKQIEDAFAKLKEGDKETLIGLMNVLSAKRGEFKQGDVLNIPGNTAHTVGSVTGLALPQEVWIRQIINQGIVGFLEIAYNQFAVSPFWVDPATLRIADPWVEKTQELLGVKVTARHIDTNSVLEHVKELTRATPQTAVKEPNSTARFGNEATEDIHEIGPHYNFSILRFGEENEDSILIDPDELGAAHNVIMALGTTESKRERLQVTLEYADGASKEIVLSRSEGLRISAGFKGRISVKALDKGAWAVHVSVPESEPEVITDDDLFVSRGMAFKRRPEIKASRAVNSGV